MKNRKVKLRVEAYIEWKLFQKLFPWYALFFSSLLLLSIFYSLWAKALVGMPFLFFAFVCLRYTYRDKCTYHNASTKRCIGLSISLFAFSGLLLVLFNIRLSLIGAVPIAIAMTWFLYVLGLKDRAEKKLKKLETKKFNLDNCTEEELVARCKERFKRDVEYKTERAIKHFILKLPHEEIDVNPEQSKKERYRFRKLLE